jgi:dienelactone hydrolase
MRRFALLSLALLATVLTGPSPARADTLRAITITAADGVAIKANVIEPDDPGKRPAIVFPASWSLNDAEYLAQARQFAAAGYVVLSYTPRGFWSSGGGIEVAGPADVSDFTTIVDWLIAHTDTDPARIGAAGLSYGAGISLIAAAHDKRVRAVAAMSTWTDLAGSLYGDEARRGQAVALLRFAAELTGRPSAGLQSAMDSFFADRDGPAVRAWAAVRSPATYLDALNRNGPAVLIANAYGDSLFPPNQLLGFYAGLTGPKRLELAPGDHGIVEAPGLFGLENHVWTSMRRWFATYVAGRSSGIEREDPVVLRVSGSGAVESSADLTAALGAPVRFNLGKAGLDANGALGREPGTWDRAIWSGVDTVACGGIALLTNGWTALTGLAPTAWLPAVNRMNAMTWFSAPIARTARVRGSARLHVNVARAQLLVAYFYDVDAAGNGRLISQGPHVGDGAIDLALPAAAYDVPAGHRFALVIDTQDPLYLDSNTLHTITFHSTAADPAWLTIPLK